MEQQIEGNRYVFIVKLLHHKFFEIIAIRKIDNKKSSITNLNKIISEIIEPVLDTTDIDEDFLYVTDFKVGKNIFERAINTLNDTDWVNKYLENELDEDFEFLNEFD